jgi:mutual gliding-motility protein MglA
MAQIDHEAKEVRYKVVYCGPPEGGKTSNLRYIHRRLDSHERGDLLSIDSASGRTLAFDFLPVAADEIDGYRIRFQLYTVPGQESLQAMRQSVLAGADGIVFVADSTPARFQANRLALDSTIAALASNGLSWGDIPVVFQFNKQDAAALVPPEELDEYLGVRTASFLACATSGYQVFATLQAISESILDLVEPVEVNADAAVTPFVPQRIMQPVAVRYEALLA